MEKVSLYCEVNCVEFSCWSIGATCLHLMNKYHLVGMARLIGYTPKELVASQRLR